ncbi:hypothetical protein FQN57_000099 [Myotisia sp. PD_48]|nr:hypothetical protein FQN57_000099 [Myotisia sp. PD_48]
METTMFEDSMEITSDSAGYIDNVHDIEIELDDPGVHDHQEDILVEDIIIPTGETETLHNTPRDADMTDGGFLEENNDHGYQGEVYRFVEDAGDLDQQSYTMEEDYEEDIDAPIPGTGIIESENVSAEEVPPKPQPNKLENTISLLPPDLPQQDLSPTRPNPEPSQIDNDDQSVPLVKDANNFESGVNISSEEQLPGEIEQKTEEEEPVEDGASKDELEPLTHPEGSVGIHEPTQELVREESKPVNDNATETHQLHRVKILYQGDEMCLFPPMADDPSEIYFLEDESLAHGTLGGLLNACRSVIWDHIDEGEELAIEIDSLGLHLTEYTAQSCTVSLAQVIQVYLDLSFNDGVTNPEALYISLLAQPTFTSCFNNLLETVQSGKGLSQIGKWEEYEDDISEEQETQPLENGLDTEDGNKPTEQTKELESENRMASPGQPSADTQFAIEAQPIPEDHQFRLNAITKEEQAEEPQDLGLTVANAEETGRGEEKLGSSEAVHLVEPRALGFEESTDGLAEPEDSKAVEDADHTEDLPPAVASEPNGGIEHAEQVMNAQDLDLKLAGQHTEETDSGFNEIPPASSHDGLEYHITVAETDTARDEGTDIASLENSVAAQDQHDGSTDIDLKTTPGQLLNEDALIGQGNTIFNDHIEEGEVEEFEGHEEFQEFQEAEEGEAEGGEEGAAEGERSEDEVAYEVAYDVEEEEEGAGEEDNVENYADEGPHTYDSDTHTPTADNTEAAQTPEQYHHDLFDIDEDLFRSPIPPAAKPQLSVDENLEHDVLEKSSWPDAGPSNESSFNEQEKEGVNEPNGHDIKSNIVALETEVEIHEISPKSAKRSRVEDEFDNTLGAIPVLKRRRSE